MSIKHSYHSHTFVCECVCVCLRDSRFLLLIMLLCECRDKKMAIKSFLEVFHAVNIKIF